MKPKAQRKAPPARRKSTLATPAAGGPTTDLPAPGPETQVRPEKTSPVDQGDDKYLVPEGSTVDSLLASGFIPRLTAIGDNLVRVMLSAQPCTCSDVSHRHTRKENISSRPSR